MSLHIHMCVYIYIYIYIYICRLSSTFSEGKLKTCCMVDLPVWAEITPIPTVWFCGITFAIAQHTQALVYCTFLLSKTVLLWYIHIATLGQYLCIVLVSVILLFCTWVDDNRLASNVSQNACIPPLLFLLCSMSYKARLLMVLFNLFMTFLPEVTHMGQCELSVVPCNVTLKEDMSL